MVHRVSPRREFLRFLAGSPLAAAVTAQEPAPATASAGERGEFGPPRRALDQRAFPHGDAAKPGPHRDGERAQSRQQGGGPLAQAATGLRRVVAAEAVRLRRGTAHGRRGNLAKSGLRFSLNASRPSWASSLM